MVNPLPQLLQTPSGLALVELQGSINIPQLGGDEIETGQRDPVAIGRLDFPDYDPSTPNLNGTDWMKRVFMYIGRHQRLTGEAKKLPKPLAVVRRKAPTETEDPSMTDAAGEKDVRESADQLEVVEIVKYKLVFSHRPEPVTTSN